MTSPSLPGYSTRRAADMLEWGFVTSTLISHATSETGRIRCGDLEFLTEPGLVRLALAETSEAKDMLLRNISVDFSSLTDLGKVIARTRVRGILDASELLRVADVLYLSRRIRNLLVDQAESAPNLAQIAESLHTDVPLEKQITQSIERDGSVPDNATPELKALRDKYHSVHQQVHDVLNKILDSRKFTELLQDNFFSLRNGRYVLPVKIEKRSAVDGIVHDISGSGQSLYIEPKEVTHLNNMLRTSELEIDREIFRILSSLSYKVADLASELENNQKVLTELDFIFAKARYSDQINANAPQVNDKGIVELKKVRHPVLIGKTDRVIPNDIALDEQKRLLIITGPNTGGKTVALKCVGIAALMVRAGLHIPASADSKISVFKRIFALIGDEQSIQARLSSFSAHLLGLRYILDHLVPDSLVLIDEIGEGTDPGQGIGLSKAVIERLVTGRVRTVITTHFAELTSMAFTLTGVVNASVELDSEKLAPTYLLIHDLPGRSSAFAISGRLGLDDDLIQKAREYATGTDNRLDEVLAGLEQQRSELRRQQSQFQETLDAATQDAQKQKELLADLRKKMAKAVSDERETIRKAFASARDKIKEILRELQQQPTYKRIQGARDKIKKVEKELGDAFPEPEKNLPMLREDLLPIDDWNKVRVGDRVFARKVNNFGTVFELPDDKEQVRLVVSGAKITLHQDDCYFKPEPEAEAPSFRKTSSIPIVDAASDSLYAPAPQTSCDLRGMTGDEAIDRVQEFLDEAVRSRIGQVTLIHGHGMGVLKREVREYCRHSPYVAKWRPGQRGEGGDGATIVDLDV